MSSKFVEINGNKIHYLEKGRGDPVIFLHGVPTSSYVWRNIIPNLAKSARCIAPDLIGMGKSSKPHINYTFADHTEYFEKFVAQLKLKNVTLVLQDLGSIVGFDYLSKHQDNVKALAFYEAHFCLEKPNHSFPVQELLYLLLQDEEAGHKTVVEDNFFIEKFLSANTFSSLSEKDISHYKQPYLNTDDRKPIWRYIRDLSENEEMHQCMANYSSHLQKSSIPKLMMYSNPGFTTSMDTVNWCKSNLPNLSLADLDEGMHLAQETNPQLFSQILSDWYIKIRK